MDIRKVLLTTNASHIYPRERDQNEYKLPYVEGNSENLRRILGSHKIRSKFCTENTLHKLLCKPKDQVATEDKTILFMKLTVVTVKQPTSVNLNGL